jgi:pimeloyl-ACP methyl ester carboxylesterase
MVLAGFGSGTLVRLAGIGLRQLNHPDPEPYLAALERFDPRHHLPRRHPARLLVQHGRADDTVPIAEARALHAAAGPDARWAEYDCGHGIDAHPEARRDRLAFLGFGQP